MSTCSHILGPPPSITNKSEMPGLRNTNYIVSGAPPSRPCLRLPWLVCEPRSLLVPGCHPTSSVKWNIKKQTERHGLVLWSIRLGWLSDTRVMDVLWTLHCLLSLSLGDEDANVLTSRVRHSGPGVTSSKSRVLQLWPICMLRRYSDQLRERGEGQCMVLLVSDLSPLACLPGWAVITRLLCLHNPREFKDCDLSPPFILFKYSLFRHFTWGLF